MGYTISPLDCDDLLHGCFPSCKFNWSPFIGHLLLINKSLAHSSTCKCLNVRGQVAVLCKTGSTWISGNTRWKEEKRKERMKSRIWFISSRFISGKLSGSPFLPPHSAMSRDTLWETQSIPTTQKIKLPLQAVRQELAFKTFPRKLDTDLYYHIWKQLLHSQGPTEERAQSMEKVVLPILLLLGQKGCNLIFV